MQGAGTRGAIGTTLDESLPNIKGSFAVRKSDASSNTIFDKRGVFSGTATTTDRSTPLSWEGATVNSQPIGFDASLSSSTYQDNAPVQQDALCINYIIKF